VNASGKECPVRHWQTIIEQAGLMPDVPDASGVPGATDGSTQDAGLRLAREAIRLARLAASTHMVLAARVAADETPT
jgi:hypothetical protein